MGSEILKIAEGFSMVAEGLRELAGAPAVISTPEASVEAQADAAKEKKAVKEEKKDAGAGKKEKAVAVEDIRAVLAQKSQDGKSVEIRELLGKYGAVKLSAVKPEDYPALLKEAEVL